MRIVAPSPALAPFVRDLMIVEIGDVVTRMRLPEPGLVLGVRYRGSASVVDRGGASRLPDASLAGMSVAATRMRTSAGGGVVLARFRSGGAARFFAQPLHELFGATVALDALLPRADVARVHERVAEADRDAARVAALESLLLARLGAREGDPIVEAAVRAIAEARGTIRVRDLARRLGISQDPLEKRFRRAVGASPKQLARVLRVRHAIDAYRPGTSLTRLALSAGYYDQAHFTRDFRALTGEPPARFFRRGAEG